MFCAAPDTPCPVLSQQLHGTVMTVMDSDGDAGFLVYSFALDVGLTFGILNIKSFL